MIIPVEWMKDNTIYKPTDINTICDRVRPIAKYTHNGKVKFLNIPVSFDTETTSFIDNNGEKTAIVYVWMLGICGLVIVGRTMEEWLYTYNRLCYNFRTCGKRVIVCYVHNLQFDFQFIRKYHTFDRVFAMGKYEPLYARTIEGFEFRCSYKLSGYKLETVAKNLRYHVIQKLTGDLDYKQLRHTETPLTHDELMYCINDAKIVNAYIDEKMSSEGDDLSTIPLTKTGYVRRYTRNNCLKYKDYQILIHQLTLSPDEFVLCNKAFMGGYTHGNSNYIGEVLENGTGNDIISSYPARLFIDMYPMSAPKHCVINSVSQLKEMCNKYCCVFTITLHDVMPKHWFDFYLSASKCDIHGVRNISNGRIVSCTQLTTTITNVDYEIIEYMYKYDYNRIYISDFIYFEKDYLPTPFVNAMLDLYQKKTELKDVAGKEIEYGTVKENQNSFYGMTVTSPIRPTYKYDGDWHDGVEPEMNEAMEKYNTSHSRFLYYPWGVFCTAYARRSIWSAIIACGTDHIYTDTDSEKCINYDKHADFFKRYNDDIIQKLKIACKCHNIPLSKCMPQTITGKVKVLGQFEIDGKYKRFKTNGAKRYMYEDEKGYHATVAGMNPVSGMKYIEEHYNNPFDGFEDGLVIPSKYSGRLVHTYIDVPREGTLTDMYGNTAHYSQLSSIHMEPATYSMGISGEFLRVIKYIKEQEVI